MSKDQNIEIIEEAEERVYELAFHFVPTIGEDEVAVQFSHLKSIIEKKGGQFISEESPRLLDLAYEISKTVKATKKRYTSAYFGWVKFEIGPESIPAIEKDMKAFETVLRYMVIATVRENTVYTEPKEKSTEQVGEKTAYDGTKDETKNEVKDNTEDNTKEGQIESIIDEVEVDKSIDELVKA